MPEVEISLAYIRNQGLYDTHQRWLDGSRKQLVKFLKSTELERHRKGQKNFRIRKDRLDTENDIHSSVKIHLSNLCREQPSFKLGKNERMLQIKENIDGRGQNSWQMIKEVFQVLISFGFCAIETNSMKTKAQGESVADDAIGGADSFSTLYPAENVLNWEFFDDTSGSRGAFREVLLFLREEKVSDGTNGVVSILKKYTIEESGNFQVQLFKVNGSISNASEKKNSLDILEEGGIKQGTLPYIPICFLGDPVEGVRNTVITQPIQWSIAVLNKQSAYDSGSYYQAFQRVFGTGVKEEEMVVMSEFTMASFEDPQASIQAIDPADPVALWRDIQQKRSHIRRKLMLQHNQLMAADSKESPSVDSKRADNETRVSYYQDLSLTVQTGFDKVLRTHAEFEGVKDLGETIIVLNKDFDLRDSETEMLERDRLWLRSQDGSQSGKMIRSQMRIADAMAMEIIPGENESEDEIRAAIIEQAKLDAEIIQVGGGVATIRDQLRANRQPQQTLEGQSENADQQ